MSSAAPTSYTPPHKAIPQLLEQATKLIDAKADVTDTLHQLGISKTDLKAQKVALDAITYINQNKIKMEKHGGIDFCGVFTLDDKLVFKPGLKRAAMELTFRNLALELGLEDYAIPGFYGSFKTPKLDLSGEDQDAIIEPLWNGGEKNYKGNKPISLKLNGIITPFLKEDNPIPSVTPFDLTKATLPLLAGGLRDIKDDGYIFENGKMVFIDNEDWAHFLGVGKNEDLNKYKASTDLQFLSKYNTELNTPLTLIEIETLSELTEKWDGDTISKKMGALPIQFFDKEAESLPIEESDSEEDDQDPPSAMIRPISSLRSAFSTFRLDDTANFQKKFNKTEKQDSAGNRVVIYKPIPTLDVKNPSKTPTQVYRDVKQDATIFSSADIRNIKTRIDSIKHFIRSMHNMKKSFSLNELICAVDPIYSHHNHINYDALNDKNLKSKASQQSPLSWVGRTSPFNFFGVGITTMSRSPSNQSNGEEKLDYPPQKPERSRSGSTSSYGLVTPSSRLRTKTSPGPSSVPKGA